MNPLKNKKGQSLVEFAIILPILLLLIMAIIEFSIMLNTYLAINNAAREGARAGIVGSTDVEIKNLIIYTSPSLDKDNLVVEVTPSEGSRRSGGMLTVRIKYNYNLTVPLISNLFNGVVALNSEISMRIE